MAVLVLCLRALGVTLLFAITLLPIADHHVGARSPDAISRITRQAEFGSTTRATSDQLDNANRHHHAHAHPQTRQPIELARPLPDYARTNIWLRVMALETISVTALVEGDAQQSLQKGSMARGFLQPMLPSTGRGGGLTLIAAVLPTTLFPPNLSWRTEAVDPAVPPSFIPLLEVPPPLRAA